MAQIEFSGTVYFQASGPWVFRPLMIHFWFVGTVYFMRGAVYFQSLMTHLGFLGTVYLSRPYILSRGPYIFSPRTVYFTVDPKKDLWIFESKFWSQNLTNESVLWRSILPGVPWFRSNSLKVSSTTASSSKEWPGISRIGSNPFNPLVPSRNGSPISPNPGNLPSGKIAANSFSRP